MGSKKVTDLHPRPPHFHFCVCLESFLSACFDILYLEMPTAKCTLRAVDDVIHVNREVYNCCENAWRLLPPSLRYNRGREMQIPVYQRRCSSKGIALSLASNDLDGF
jgi:hypothetical protein